MICLPMVFIIIQSNSLIHFQGHFPSMKPVKDTHFYKKQIPHAWRISNVNNEYLIDKVTRFKKKCSLEMSGSNQKNPAYLFDKQGHPCSGGKIRTCDLRVMSPTSYLCSTPQCHNSSAKVVNLFNITKSFEMFLQKTLTLPQPHSQPQPQPQPKP